MAENEPTTTISNVFNNSNMDYFTFMDIDNTKHTFLKRVTTLSIDQAILETIGLFVYMLSMLEKYFMDKDGNVKEIENQKIKGYNLYDLQKAIPYCKDINDVLRVCSLAFTNFNVLNKKIGNAIPTTRESYKKKMIRKLFSIVVSDDTDEFSEKIIKRYHKAIKEIGVPNTTLTFDCFCVAIMNEYDLDYNEIIIGANRIGKSTILIIKIRLILAFRLMKPLREIDDYLIEQKFTFKYFFYNQTQSIKTVIQSLIKGIIGIDEGYLVGDRRNSMKQEQIKLGETIFAYASANNIIFVLMQNLSDLDLRFVEKSNCVSQVTKRGQLLKFIKEKHFALTKTYYGFEHIIKNPNLLSSFKIGNHALKGLASFVCEENWESIENNNVYIQYKKDKKHYQSIIEEVPLIKSKQNAESNKFRYDRETGTYIPKKEET